MGTGKETALCESRKSFPEEARPEHREGLWLQEEGPEGAAVRRGTAISDCPKP